MVNVTISYIKIIKSLHLDRVDASLVWPHIPLIAEKSKKRREYT